MEIQGIDGIDNGINQYDTDKLPRYANETHLSSRVGRLNPDWMDEQTPEAENQAFHKAMNVAGAEFLQVLMQFSLLVSGLLGVRSLSDHAFCSWVHCDSIKLIVLLLHNMIVCT